MDLGERRIGLAFGETATNLVFPAGHLIRTKLSEDLDRVLATGQDRKVDAFVVGMPYSLDGNAGPQVHRSQGFVNALRKRTSVPIYTTDERFTSVEAEAILRESGQQPSRQRGSVDEAAAALILERFLASQASSASDYLTP